MPYGLDSLARYHSDYTLKLRILKTVGKTAWTGNQPDTRPLPTWDNTNKEQVETDIFA
jgi:hypothetical protein